MKNITNKKSTPAPSSAPKLYDMAIIGAGPAGLAAAIYAKRAESVVVLLDAGAPGGKMIKTSEIENYPGFNSILGSDLSVNMFMQTQNLGIPFQGNNVQRIEVLTDKNFCLYLDDKTTIKSKTVVIATGTIERLIGAAGESKFYGKGVSNCAVCDGAFYKNEAVVVIGGGYSALEEAIFLSKIAKSVTLVHRRQGFRADRRLVDQVKANSKIKLMLDYILLEVTGGDIVNGAIIKNVITNEQITLDCKAVFPLIGSDPVSEFISDLGITDERGYILCDNRNATAIPGLYAAGDVTTTPLRQIVTAVADGSRAAQFAIYYFEQLNH